MVVADRRGLLPLAIATALCIAAYHLSILGIFYLLPLQWVRLKQGDRPFLIASVLALAGIAAVEAGIRSLAQSPWSVLDSAMLGLPLLLIVGWAAIQAMDKLAWRFLNRLLVVTVVLGIVLFSSALTIVSSKDYQQVLMASFDTLWKSAAESSDMAKTMATLDRTWFLDVMKSAFLGVFVFIQFGILGFTEWLTRRLGWKQDGAGSDAKAFFVPAYATNTFLALCGLALVAALAGKAVRAVPLEWLAYVGINGILILFVVHVRAGLGIVLSWVGAKVPQRSRWLVWSTVGVMALVGAWPVLLVFLAILAVLELWMNFRNRTQGVGL